MFKKKSAKLERVLVKARLRWHIILYERKVV